MSQERFWFVDQLQPGTPVHNLAYAVDIDGAVEPAAIQHALHGIVARHEILRVRFHTAHGHLQQDFTKSPEIRLRHVEITNEKHLTELTNAIAHEPFDYFGGPLFRVALLRISDHRHRLLLVAHHAIFDGWSLGVFLAEFTALYRASTTDQSAGLPGPALQYGDYACWQRTLGEEDGFNRELAFWAHELADQGPPLDLPTDFPRPLLPSYRGNAHRFTVPADVADAVRAVAAEESATAFMAWLTVFQILLYRHTGQTDINVGSPVANRHDERLESLIGPFINVLVLRSDLSGDPTFRELLVRVRRRAVRAFAHAQVPYQQVVAHLAGSRAGTSLFRTALAFQNFSGTSLDLTDELRMTPFAVDMATAQQDLALFLTPTPGGLEGLVQYDTDLFRADTITGLFTDLTGLANRLAKDPDLPVTRLRTSVGVRPRRVARAAEFPLSSGQEHYLAAERTRPGDPAWKIVTALSLPGSTHLPALTKALCALEDRHEALRAVVVDRDRPRQVITAAGRVRPRVMDLGELSEEDWDLAVRREADAASRAPFDLTVDAPMRACLLRSGDEYAVLLLTLHRFAADETSRDILLADLLARYRATTGDAPTVQHPDFALWQRQRLSGQRRQDLVAYWRSRLAGAPGRLDLPARPATGPPSTRAASVPLTFSAELAHGLRRLCDEHDVPLSVPLLAGIAVLLKRYSGQADVVIGIDTDHRSIPELADVVGDFTDDLPVRITVDEAATFHDLLTTVAASVREDMAHRDLPSHELGEVLQVPLCQAALRLTGATAAPDLPTRDLGEQAMELDLLFVVADDPERPAGRLCYREAVLPQPVAANLADHLPHLLGQLTNRPADAIAHARTLTPAQRARVLAATEPDEPATDQTLHGRFAQQVRRQPDAEALTQDDVRLTYRELDEWSNRVAGGLLDHAVRPGQPVALLMDNHPGAVAALFGVLKAGAVFACLDPANPTDRLARALVGIDPTLVLMDQAAAIRHGDIGRPTVVLTEDTFADHPATDPVPDVRPADLAYLAHTSGSTGAPKAIPHTHRDLDQFVRWQSRQFGIGPGQRVAQLASLSFDVAYCEIFGALCHGATLCLRPAATKADPLILGGWLTKHRVTLLQVIPRLFREILAAVDLTSAASPTVLGDLKTLMFVGEPLPTDLVRTVRRRLGDGCAVVNMYGPTEVVAATFHVVEDLPALPTVPIGRPIPGRHVVVLDDTGQPCPPGVIGEIWIGSPYLTPGYRHDEEETRRRFLPSPLPERPGTYYRTGDLARLLPSGELEFAGRADNQVKLSGIRLELEEVELAVARHPGVRECAATVRTREDSQRLVAYVVPTGHPWDDLHEFLRRTLPTHIVPAELVPLDALPRTATGKVDRGALPEPARVARSPRTPAGTALESELAGMVAEVLGVDEVGVTDDFFALGGNSLQAARLVNRIREHHGVDIPLRDLFAAPTVLAVAKATELARRDLGYEQRLALLEQDLAALTDDEIRTLLSRHQEVLTSEEGHPGEP